MDIYIVVVAGFGVMVLLTAWLPMVLRRLPLSLPICCVGIGAAMSAVPTLYDLTPHPSLHLKLIEHATEAVVVISLMMGAGLKIDRMIGWKRWAVTWRLLAVGMPLTILALALLGSALLGLGGAAALLASSLAPTDPVLASDVQVGHPAEEHEDEPRFALTSEAGLNDGLAFPFVNLAIAMAGTGGLAGLSWSHWLAVDVVWKIVVGSVLGAVIGRGLGWLTFHLPNVSKLSAPTGDGFVALGVTCIAYGGVQAVDGYGFVGVFAAALALRASNRGHDYHRTMHDYAEELERILMMVLLVGFGAVLVGGGLLHALTWPAVAFALLALLVVRPLSGWISLLGSARRSEERAVVSFFGIRGLGTVYYLSFAIGHAPFEQTDLLWATAGLTVLISILMHGIMVTPVLLALDGRWDAGRAPLPGRSRRFQAGAGRSIEGFVTNEVDLDHQLRDRRG